MEANRYDAEGDGHPIFRRNERQPGDAGDLGPGVLSGAAGCTAIGCRNLQREKARDFSGRVHLTIEIRQTQETLTAIDPNTEMYVDAVIALLGEARGQWGDGASYSGGYEVGIRAGDDGREKNSYSARRSTSPWS